MVDSSAWQMNIALLQAQSVTPKYTAFLPKNKPLKVDADDTDIPQDGSEEMPSSRPNWPVDPKEAPHGSPPQPPSAGDPTDPNYQWGSKQDPDPTVSESA